MRYTQLITFVLGISVLLLSSGCAKVPMASKDKSESAKLFKKPPSGSSGLYVYRSSGIGTALKKDIYINKKCLGQSAQNVFFYKTVKADVEHEIATESEFSPNVIKLKTESGKNYFVRQRIKPGVFVGGARLFHVNENDGKKAVSELNMAKNGICSKDTIE